MTFSMSKASVAILSFLIAGQSASAGTLYRSFKQAFDNGKPATVSDFLTKLDRPSEITEICNPDAEPTWLSYDPCYPELHTSFVCTAVIASDPDSPKKGVVPTLNSVAVNWNRGPLVRSRMMYLALVDNHTDGRASGDNTTEYANIWKKIDLARHPRLQISPEFVQVDDLLTITVRRAGTLMLKAVTKGSKEPPRYFSCW